MENPSNLTSVAEDESENTNLPSAFSSKPARPPTQASSEKYSPLDWQGYFDQEDDVSIPDSDNVFHIYKAGTEGPVVFCLHGGGYSGYAHRARLEETEQYWRGWYEGLSEKFLSSPVPKLLLLAGTDRLDRTPTIGQMQGKFQKVIVRHTGHAIQIPGLRHPSSAKP